MSFAPDNLGEVEEIARAIGLVNGSGFNDDWLSRPGLYLSSILAEDAQRNALIGVVDDLLGGSARETDSRGQTWLPLFECSDPRVTFYAVVDDRPTDHVRVGLGVKASATSPDASARFHAPLFKAARSGHSVANPILLGQAGGVIDFTCDITIDPASPAPGQAHLRAVGLNLSIPTDGSTPDFGLSVTGLQLPGASQPRDIVLSLAHIDELDDIVLDLVLGLIQAQAGQAGGAVRSFARLIGLSAGTAIPTLPLDQLAQRGVSAIADWAAALFRSPAARDAWLGELSALLANGASVNAGRVELPFGAAKVTIGIDVADGSGGYPVISPALGIEVGAGQAVARLEAQLLRFDIGARTAIALPSLDAYGSFGLTAAGGAALLTGQTAVDAVRFGLSLNQDRRPHATLALINVKIGSHPVYPVLDLSSPGAVVEAAGQVIDDVLDQALGGLGPAETAVRMVLGLSTPPEVPALVPTDIAHFLRDPLGAVRSYWLDLVLHHGDGVPLVLAQLHDLIADGSAVGAISGSGAPANAGAPADPWILSLVGPLRLEVVRAPGANRLQAALTAAYWNDTLGEGCTRLDASVSLGLLDIDLDGGPTTFLTSVNASVSGRPRGSRRATIELPPLTLSASNVGLAANWTPAQGLKIGFSAPNPAASVNGVALPIDIPDVSQGFHGLSDLQWDAVEFLTGQLARLTPASWVADLAEALGWVPAAPNRGAPNRLRLAALIANPETALLDWLNGVILSQASRVETLLAPLARVLTGAAGATGAFYGEGRPANPYRVPLSAIPDAPEFALWVEPDGPPLSFVTNVTDRLRSWRPGAPGLSPGELADALTREARAAPEIAAIVSGRDDLGSGLADLIDRWTLTDGRILAPSSDSPGVTVHLVEAAYPRLFDALDLPSLLAAPAATTIRVAIAASVEEAAFDDAPADRIIDLTAASLAPNAFTPPAAAAGDWFVALGPRAACRLAAGDPDGVGGQQARLERVIEPFRAIGGGIALIAEGGAGYAALGAAGGVAEITALVTLGTPLGAVAFSILAAEPAASTLRLLDALIPQEDVEEPFDDDLQLGRDLVRGLVALADNPALAAELAPPATASAPRPGLEAHAVFGSLPEEAILGGLTAILAAGLSTRANARVDVSNAMTGLGAGVNLPIALGATGVRVEGRAAFEVFGADLAGAPAIRQTRPLVVHLEIRRAGGWLVGGPGSASGQDLRWVEFNMRLPLGDAGAAEAEAILHEPRVFTIRRDRWIVRHAGSTSSGDEVVTTNLPEVGVLLSGALRELSLDPDPQIAAAISLLEAAGVFLRNGQGGGFVAAALDSILHQPDLHFRDLVAGAARPALQSALNTLIAPIAGLTVDLGGRRVDLSLSGTPGTLGLLSWSIALSAAAGAAFAGEVRLGAPGAGLRLALSPLTASLETPRLGQTSPDTVAVWPSPDLSRLIDSLPSVLAASAIRLGLDYLRQLDETTKPLIDAALDGIGLLTGAAGDDARQIRVPLGFLSDPAGYFTSPAGFGAPGGFSPAKAAAFVDALKPLLNLSGGPGEIQLAAGAALSVSGASGALRLAITLDNSAFASPAGDPPRLAFGGAFTLELPGGGSPRPTVDLFVGLPGAATGRQAAHLVVGDGVRLFLRPATGSDISLFPDPPGLGSLAGAALQALPFALDQVAAIAAPPAALTAARVVTALGDALDLRTAGHFDAAKLSAWSANPAQRFADRLPILAQAALTDLAAAVGPALPTGLSIVASPNLLTLTAGPVGIAFGTAPFSVAIEASVAGVPFAGNVAASIAFDASGLRSFTGTAGPATIPVNGAALHPFIGFAAGPSPQNGPRFEVGSATDAAGATGVLARWVFTGGGFSLVARDGGSETSDPEHVALALARMALDIVAHFAFEEAAVQTLLEKPIPHAAAANAKVKSLLQGVFLQDGVEPPALDPALFDPAQLLGRFMRLLRNVAQAGATAPVADGLSVGARLDANIVKLTLGVNGRIDLPTGDVKVSIEADSRWIVGAPAAGLAIGFVDLSGPAPVFAPSLSVDGIGLRIGKASGPLLDSAVKLGSVAAHFYADISPAGLAGGVQLELSDLAVGASGAGGNNAVAQGVVGDTGSGGNALAPAFSPALAVQKHQGGPVLVSLRAGEGDGPWWLSIQKGFGPLYVEQVGFGVTVRQDQLEKISVLFDGRISIAGLVAAVDDLQITFTVTSGASLFDASRWAVDLGGLAVNADISGVTLAGGLRKFGGDADHPDVEYIGMLMARVATYGLSIYGGYGTGVSDGVRFTAFFAFGAVTGPFGGPPAFFLTGVGGGFGINRDLVFPSSLADFSNFVMIQALDPSASPSSDPMEALQQIRDTFPMRRDRFWFAAGVSFTCFALVDGVAVVALSFGGGFELTLLGLARMALPRPQLRLVSIELGLMVRFSTRDGVLWIQAELTENSWLLHESVRLTGGFAYVMWFAGDHSGEFVLTLGGYHPSFHRDGYPDVPRLGFRWQATPFISIKGGSYFALTSEALMAGGALEASATLGPAWASISFEANVIIYFDPFRYEGDAQARVAAGVTIDLWLGEVTISVHLSARIDVAGPDFHGSATFEVGPIGLTVRFGGSDQSGWEPISWEAFVNKYLEAESPGVARTLTSITGRGSIPPGAGANGDEKGTADGSTEKPFEVFSEFELTVTTTAPATRLVAGGQTRDVAPSGLLGVAPVNAGSMSSVVTLTLRPAGGGADVIGGLRLASTSLGSFPVGAWGPAQSREDKKIPQGEVIDALNGALFVAEAKLEGTIPKEVDYNQVEAGPRHPLPFVTEAADRARVLAGAKKLVDLLPANPTADEIYAKASPWLAEGGARPLALASLRGGRAAPPRLGALGDRMATQTPTAAIALAVADPPKTVDRAVKAPRAIGILHPLARPEAKARRTTVKDDLPRVLPPTMAEADAMVAAGLAAKLVRVAPVAGVAKRTLIAQRSIPLTRQARMAPAASNARGTDSVALSRLKGLSAGLGGSRASSADRVVRPGEVAILSMPNARRDSGADPRPTLQFKGPARVTMFGAGGGILSDVVGDSGAPQIPQGAERIAVWASPVDPTTAMLGLAGWNAAQSLAYVGWATCLCGGGSIYSEGGRIRRGPESFTTGWIAAREFLAGSRIITTRFTKPAATLVVVIDEAVGDSADFSLSVRGAAIASDPTGAEAAPVLLSQGSRRILIYALAAGPADFAVEILRDGGVQVSGVMASPASPAVTAARLTEQSAEALVDGLAGPDGEVALKFVQGKR